MKESGFTKTFFIGAIVLLALAGGLVALFDPFYHYHKPVFSMKEVVTKSEYQCIGTLRNFSYDSILLGSSIAENYNNRWFDEGFGTTTVKGIKSGGTTVDLLYYLKVAFEEQELKDVYYCLDITALQSDPEEVFPNETFPLYLFNRNPFDDVQYLWNKDVLCESIPYQVAVGLQEEHDEGLSYSWIEGKTFSAKTTLGYYERPEVAKEQTPKEQGQDWVKENLAMIGEQIEAHPETTFRFILSPFSILWWDEIERKGTLDQKLYTLELAFDKLLSYENVEMYCYMDEEEIITNLDNYMDPVHFNQEINHYMVEQMLQNQGRVTKENAKEKLAHMREIIERAKQEQLPELFDTSRQSD